MGAQTVETSGPDNGSTVLQPNVLSQLDKPRTVVFSPVRRPVVR